MALTSLGKRGFGTVKPESAGSRLRALTRTSKGQHARDTYFKLLPAIEGHWHTRYGEQTVRTLRNSLERLVDQPTLLFRGLEPYSDGWRATVPKPEGLPSLSDDLAPRWLPGRQLSLARLSRAVAQAKAPFCCCRPRMTTGLSPSRVLAKEGKKKHKDFRSKDLSVVWQHTSTRALEVLRDRDRCLGKRCADLSGPTDERRKVRGEGLGFPSMKRSPYLVLFCSSRSTG